MYKTWKFAFKYINNLKKKKTRRKTDDKFEEKFSVEKCV